MTKKMASLNFGRGLSPMVLLFLNFWFVFGAVNSQSASPPPVSAPHHKLSISGTQAFVQGIECRRLSNTSTDMDMAFSIIECATRSECEDKLPCLRYNLNCAHREKVSRGEPCFTSSSSTDKNLNATATTTPTAASDTTNDNCLVVDTKSIKYGLVECESRSKDNLTIHRTTDYFYKGIDYDLYLVSNSSDINSSRFEIKMDKQAVNLKGWNTLIYTSEAVRLSCSSANFFYDGKTLKLTLLDKTGAPFKINDKLFHWYTYGGNSYRGLYQYRVPVEVAGIRCSVERRNDSVVTDPLPKRIEKSINFTTVDPPLDLTAKSLEDGKSFKFNLNQTLGCKLTNASTEERVELNRILFPMVWGVSGADRTFVIESIIVFLRFREFSREAYGCKILDGRHVIQNSKQHFDYIVTIVQNPPKILNANATGTNDTKNFINLTGHVHRMLKCKYSGVPTPYATWLQDGQDILDPSTSWRTNYADYDGDSAYTNEESVLVPPAMTMLNGTKNKNGGINYTCVVINHLGRASFSFLIADDDADGGGQSNFPFGQPNNDCVAISWLLALMTLAFLFTLVFSMRHYLWMLLDKYKKDDQQQLQLEVQPE